MQSEVAIIDNSIYIDSIIWHVQYWDLMFTHYDESNIESGKSSNIEPTGGGNVNGSIWEEALL